MNIGYTTREKVENFINKPFPEVSTDEFNLYIGASEKYINNYLGYNSQTTLSGILTESIVREKSVGKIDNHGNLVVDLMHPPVHFDNYFNPQVSLLEFNQGGVSVSLQLTDGSQNTKNTVLEVSENRRKVYYPHMYFLPAISSVTPSAKINLYNLRDVRFWVDISYIGGFDAVPEDIVLAANYLVAEFLLYRDNPNFLVSLTQGSMSQTFARKSSGGGLKISEGMHLAQSLLQPYVRNTW